MDQSRNKITSKDPHAGQFEYLGRWVDKVTFRAFVYDRMGVEKLASSYNEFESLTNSGLWFASKADASNKQEKQKNGPVRAAG